MANSRQYIPHNEQPGMVDLKCNALLACTYHIIIIRFALDNKELISTLRSSEFNNGYFCTTRSRTRVTSGLTPTPRIFPVINHRHCKIYSSTDLLFLRQVASLTPLQTRHIQRRRYTFNYRSAWLPTVPHDLSECEYGEFETLWMKLYTLAYLLRSCDSNQPMNNTYAAAYLN